MTIDRNSRYASETTDSRPPNLTPLLDVIFAVLACFAYLLTMSEPKPRGLDVELPSADRQVASEIGGADAAPALDLSYFADGRISVDGEEVDLAGLDGALQRALADAPDREVRLRGDRNATHETTVRVLEAVHRRGVAIVAIVVDPQSPTQGGQ